MRFILGVFIFFVFGNGTNAQLRINEICSSNDSLLRDQFGDYPDWIEFYNPNEEPIQMSDYFITDDLDVPKKWLLPNRVLEPKGFQIIYASGKGLVSDRHHANFKIAKSGEVVYLFNRVGNLIDRMILPKNETDWSYGRITDGLAPFAVFKIPSPGISNVFSEIKDQTAPPEYSIKNQFHSNEIDLEISSIDTAKVYYTLNGSLPDSTSKLYTSPISISKTTVVRAIAFLEDEIPSEVATNTYFIGESSTLPIVSLSTDSLLLFDSETGMLVEGPDAEPDFPFWGANFWKDIEVPMHFEYFNEKGDFLIEFGSGSKVHGGRSSRTKIQRSLRFRAKPEYGPDKFWFPFFDNKPEVNDFETLVLRNSSGDFNNTHFRDGFISHYLSGNEVDLDAMGYQPCTVFLNGKYWGVMNLREKSDESFVAANYGIELNKLDVLEEDTLIIWGDRNEFQTDLDFVWDNDLSENIAFGEISNRIDLESFADYIIVETFLNNTDWGHNNLKLWKEKSGFGKWRYLFFDLDAAMQGFPWTNPTTEVFIQKMNEYTDEENPHIFIFKSLLENTKFRNYFINRYCDLLNTIFRPEIFSAALRNHADFLEPEMVKHYARWNCSACHSFDRWENIFVPRIIQYSLDKPELSRKELQTYFNTGEVVKLELDVFPPEAGIIQINSIRPEEYPWDGLYFKGVPVELTGVANSGFIFDHWELLNEEISPINSTLKKDFANDERLVAHFVRGEEINEKIFANPNPAFDELNIQIGLTRRADVYFEIYNAKGKLVYETAPEKFEAGLLRKKLPINSLGAGMYILKSFFDNEIRVSKFIKI